MDSIAKVFACATVASIPCLAHSATFDVGDVFVSIGDGKVAQLSGADLSLVQTLESLTTYLRTERASSGRHPPPVVSSMHSTSDAIGDPSCQELWPLLRTAAGTETFDLAASNLSATRSANGSPPRRFDHAAPEATHPNHSIVARHSLSTMAAFTYKADVDEYTPGHRGRMDAVSVLERPSQNH